MINYVLKKGISGTATLINPFNNSVVAQFSGTAEGCIALKIFFRGLDNTTEKHRVIDAQTGKLIFGHFNEEEIRARAYPNLGIDLAANGQQDIDPFAPNYNPNISKDASNV